MLRLNTNSIDLNLYCVFPTKHPHIAKERLPGVFLVGVKSGVSRVVESPFSQRGLRLPRSGLPAAGSDVLFVDVFDQARLLESKVPSSGGDLGEAVKTLSSYSTQ